MFKAKIITVGGVKNPSLKKLANEYIKRIGLFAKVSTIEIKELTKETCLSQDVSILLTEEGTTFDSLSFANTIPKWNEQGQRELTFIIAGPFGFDRELLKHVDHTLSLSPLTFPHEIAYVLLLEQLYRAGTILNNKKYHY